MSISTKEAMPTFSKALPMPANGSTFVIVLRYYAPYGEEWKQPIALPTITYAGNIIDMKLDHAGYMCEVDYNQYLTGQINNGYDQYAQYYYRQVSFQPTEQDLFVQGSFQRVGYWSMVVYIDGGIILHEVKDFELDSANNPYLEGNQSVFAYDKPAGAIVALGDKSLDLPVKTDNKTAGNGPWRDTESGRVYFFRSDKSTLSWGEDVAPDGCSRGYFSAWPNISAIDGVNQFMILRYKLPTTFVRQTAPDTPDMVFGHYPSREVSISSTASEGVPVEKLLEFWTINSAMLEATKDSDGYAYVFFAPIDYVRREWEAQGSPRFTAPMITWGKYRGHLLAFSTHNVIVRYRAPMSNWEGSPEQCPCYEHAIYNEPIDSPETDTIYPTLYSDIEENFLNGKIGDVEQNSAWPTMRPIIKD